MKCQYSEYSTKLSTALLACLSQKHTQSSKEPVLIYFPISQNELDLPKTVYLVSHRHVFDNLNHWNRDDASITYRASRTAIESVFLLCLKISHNHTVVAKLASETPARKISVCPIYLYCMFSWYVSVCNPHIRPTTNHQNKHLVDCANEGACLYLHRSQLLIHRFAISNSASLQCRRSMFISAPCNRAWCIYQEEILFELKPRFTRSNRSNQVTNFGWCSNFQRKHLVDLFSSYYSSAIIFDGLDVVWAPVSHAWGHYHYQSSLLSHGILRAFKNNTQKKKRRDAMVLDKWDRFQK